MAQVPKPEPEPTHMAQLFGAVDHLNDCWQQIIDDGDTRTRPWIIWEEKRVVVTQFTNHPRIIHE